MGDEGKGHPERKDLRVRDEEQEVPVRVTETVVGIRPG